MYTTVGISSGDSATFAFYNSIHLVRTALLGGENLTSLLKETDYYLEVMARFKNKISIPYLSAYKDTITTLIGKADTPQNGNTNQMAATSDSSLYAQRHNETIYFNRVLQSFWVGYSTRCHHYATKALEMHLLGRHNKHMILFYAAINSFRGIKNNNGSGSQFLKVKALYKDAITALQTEAELSPLDFSSKVIKNNKCQTY